MQHVIAGKQLLIRRAAGAASKSATGIAYRSRSLCVCMILRDSSMTITTGH